MSDTTPPFLGARQLVGLLAEPHRRAVVAALILGADTVDQLVGRTGLTTRQVVDALGRLHRAGLVEHVGDDRYLLLDQVFAVAARAEGRAQGPTGPESEFADEPLARRRILDRWLQSGRLQGWPAKRSHRLVVLDHVAQRFEPGRHYTERQVNAMLVGVDPDVATVRRYLVDEAMLDRADGLYWRIGGSFPVD